MITKTSLASALSVPTTESIKYAGSKLKLLPYILEMIGKLPVQRILDGFSGSTRVSQALAQRGYQVVSNDISAWSYVLASCYLGNKQSKAYYQELITHLNQLEPTDGWFSEHYGGYANDGCSRQADGLKKPWQIHNTRKLDAIRLEIERLDLHPTSRAVALTSLMLALDEVDNTLGHFSSYLREWSPRSYKELELKVPALFDNALEHTIVQDDIFQTSQQYPVDLAYFDPPYGSNNEKMPPSRVRYAAYYHLWTSLCLFDKPPLFGKAKRRYDSSDKQAASIFEEFRKNEAGHYIALEAIRQLLHPSQARYIILSYSSGGRATAEELQQVMQQIGTILEVRAINYKRNVMAHMRSSHTWVRESEEKNTEFLFLIEKN